MKKGKTREENRGEEDAHRAAAIVLKAARWRGWTERPAARTALRPNTIFLQMHCCELYEFIKLLKGGAKRI